ncbi:MAG TPA: DUF2911 domain-containing protein [Chitinophagaceae bacterium]|jgi:hypothetical protein|nr:DUF2911 domain-containing protein [Chitinophagaceae bacterium]
MGKNFGKSCLSLVASLTVMFHGSSQKYSQKDRGLATYKLGTDTTVVQYFEFENRKFHTTIFTFTGSVAKYEGDGELDETGDLKKVFSKTFNLDSTNNWKLIGEGVNVFNGDSMIYTATLSGKQLRRAVASKGIVFNVDPISFFVFPYIGFFAPSKLGDTIFHCHLAFGECRQFQVARTGKSELKVGSNALGKLKLFVDDRGRMQAIDAIGSSINVVATVERDKKNYDQYLDAMAKRRWAEKSFAPRTFRDTARLVVENKKIEVDYWRPYRRNRQIFGAVVPWDRVWRTGANNATQLRSDDDLEFDGNKLTSGKYSIWTYPTENGWQLIFNKKADTWGTEYDSTANSFRVPMTVEKTAAPVEILTISLLPENNDTARLLIEWEYYKAWANFKIDK